MTERTSGRYSWERTPQEQVMHESYVRWIETIIQALAEADFSNAEIANTMGEEFDVDISPEEVEKIRKEIAI